MINSEQEPVSMTEVSRHTGKYLNQARTRGPVLVRDRYGEVVLEIRRFTPEV